MRQSAILGASKLGKGPWRPEKKVTAIAFMGGCEVDFRQAELEDGVTEVSAISILGDVNIVVTPDIPVTISGVSILGSRNIARTKELVPSLNAKKSIHVKTVCILGGCYVTEFSEYEEEWT
ncbi:MAG: LiaF domain-containing protein [Dehalococcoidia bacterium]